MFTLGIVGIKDHTVSGLDGSGTTFVVDLPMDGSEALAYLLLPAAVGTFLDSPARQLVAYLGGTGHGSSPNMDPSDHSFAPASINAPTGWYFVRIS